MSKVKENMSIFIKKDWSLTEKILVGISLFSMGLFLGALSSLVKKGIQVSLGIGSYNGHQGDINK